MIQGISDESKAGVQATPCTRRPVTTTSNTAGWETQKDPRAFAGGAFITLVRFGLPCYFSDKLLMASETTDAGTAIATLVRGRTFFGETFQ